MKRCCSEKFATSSKRKLDHYAGGDGWITGLGEEERLVIPPRRRPSMRSHSMRTHPFSEALGSPDVFGGKVTES